MFQLSSMPNHYDDDDDDDGDDDGDDDYRGMEKYLREGYVFSNFY